MGDVEPTNRHRGRVLDVLDVGRYRVALAEPEVDYVFTPRPPRPGAATLAARGAAPLDFHHADDFGRLRLALVRELSRTGAESESIDLLTREILHLVRFFSGISGDPHPAVDLVYASADRPPPSNGGACLVSPLLGRGPTALRGVWVSDVGRGPEPRGASSEAEPSTGEHDLWLRLSTPRTPSRRSSVPEPLIENGRDEAVEVLLVTMPFGPLQQASLGLSLLAGTIPDVRCEISYYTLRFAEQIGVPTYNWISDTPIDEALVGEWLFSEALFGERAPAVAPYIEEILSGLPRCDIEELLRVRGQVEGFLEDCLREVLAKHPKIVGFTSVFNQHVAALALAERIKRARPEITILVGGANCEGAMGLEAARRFDFVDAFVSGEGERVFPLLVDEILAGRPIPRIPGVHTRRTALLPTEAPKNTPLVESMDELPVPRYDDFFEQWERAESLEHYTPRLMFETSRGCWWGAKHHCTFCGLNGDTLRYRSKSGTRAMSELEDLVAAHPGLSVCVVDNIMDMNYFKTFLPTLADSELELELFYETKANLKKSQLEAMRAAGIKALQPGIESFSEGVLKLMRKGVSPLQNIQLLKWCLELGLIPFWNVLWGFPGEDPEEYAQLTTLVESLHHLPPPTACGQLRLDRFSPNFEQAEQLGFRNVRPTPAYGHIYPFPEPALANLAYYFTFEYADRRDPRTYASPLTDAVKRWKVSFDRSHLVYIDKGEDLVLADTRSCAARRLTVLSGSSRALYLACDAAKSMTALSTVLGLGVEEIEQLASAMVRDRFMLRANGCLLSLATPYVSEDGCSVPPQLAS